MSSGISVVLVTLKFKALLAQGNEDLNMFNKFMSLCVLKGSAHGSIFAENEKESINPGESLWQWGFW